MPKYQVLIVQILNLLILTAATHTPEFTEYGYRLSLKEVEKIKEVDFISPSVPWNTSNDLTSIVGMPFKAIGSPLIITGVVTDIDRVPVDWVEIRIIQANHYGVYNYTASEDDPFFDPNFHSTGTAVTDNSGRYAFKTIFPGHYQDRASHVHLLLTRGPHQYEVDMFFENNPQNAKDPVYSKLKADEALAQTAKVYWLDPNDKQKGKVAELNVILNYIQPTKTI